MASTVYRSYTREDALCQTNGYFSLNLRQSAVATIRQLLDLTDDSLVGWIGCGDGRELLSLAKECPTVRFDAFEVNEAALQVARRVARQHGITNVVFHGDFMEAPVMSFTHIYSTAISGPLLYEKLHASTSGTLCILQSMWNPEWERGDVRVGTVRLAGSGEQRQLWSARRGTLSRRVSKEEGARRGATPR